MAHFARIEGGIVREVIVVHNEQAPDEVSGIAFCRSIFGDESEWVQTSYNANSIEGKDRGKYAAIGDVWDGEKFNTPNTQTL